MGKIGRELDLEDEILSALPPKRAAFVREYCVDRNATQAAIRAGYSKATAYSQGSRLLRDGEVQAAINEQLGALAEKTEADAAWVRRRLKQEAEDFSEGSSAAARIRAVELIAKLNGDFELDNRQKAGIFDEVPSERLELIRQKLRELGGSGSGEDTSGSGRGGFTH